MLQHSLSMQVFQKGLNRYLLNRMYKNAEQDDLWSVLTEQSRKNQILAKNTSIKDIMDTWTLQTGFPLVTLTRNYKNNSLKFAQKQFLLNNKQNETDDKNNNTNLWYIPISYRTKSGSLKTVWMPKQPVINIQGGNLFENDWILVNINQTGYYRVNYDSKNWELLSNQLKHDHLVFDPKNRAQLVDDALHLASAGYLGYDVALNATLYLKKEREYIPWKAAFASLDYIQEMFLRTAHFDKFKVFLQIIKATKARKKKKTIRHLYLVSIPTQEL